jgi:hypothetical protein
MAGGAPKVEFWNQDSEDTNEVTKAFLRNEKPSGKCLSSIASSSRSRKGHHPFPTQFCCELVILQHMVEPSSCHNTESHIFKGKHFQWIKTRTIPERYRHLSSNIFTMHKWKKQRWQLALVSAAWTPFEVHIRKSCNAVAVDNVQYTHPEPRRVWAVVAAVHLESNTSTCLNG